MAFGKRKRDQQNVRSFEEQLVDETVNLVDSSDEEEHIEHNNYSQSTQTANNSPQIEQFEVDSN